MKIQWSPLAVERIGEIADYIAQDSPVAAGGGGYGFIYG